MNLDDDQSSATPDSHRLGNHTPDEESVSAHESRTTSIRMKALFFAFIQEIMPELLERIDRESQQLDHGSSVPANQRAAVLRQEAVIESEQFISNAIVRVLEDYHAIVVDGQRISLDHKQRIIFRALVERHRKGDFSYVTAAQLTTIIATQYCDKLWNNLDKDDVVRVYSRLRREISSKATSAIIEHNGTRGPDSGYRLSIPAGNILLPEKTDFEDR